MTDPDAVARIVAGLTKAQREIALDGGRCVRAYKPAHKLVALGIWSDRGDEYTIWPDWTPLGLAVRAALLEQQS